MIASRMLAAVALTVGAAPALAAPPAPAPGPADGPPSAWIETASGDRWMQPLRWEWCPAYGTCGKQPVASKALGAACMATATQQEPEVHLAPSERIRLHLGFTPASAVLAFGADLDTPDLADTLEWTAPAAGAGALRLAVTADPGKVTYGARVVVGDDATPPEVRLVAVVAHGVRPDLLLRVSEPVNVNGCVVGTAVRVVQYTPRVLVRAGLVRVSLGPLVRPGVHVVRLRLRDRAGNTTLLARRIGVLPGRGGRGVRGVRDLGAVAD